MIFIEENQIDGEHHANGVHPFTRHDPQPGTVVGPAARLSQQSDETAQIVVRHAGIGSDKGLPSLVVDVHYALALFFLHTIEVPQ